jgi:hypothetical protein
MVMTITSFATAVDAFSLAGDWRVRLDEADEGLAAKWFAEPLATDAAAALPGSLAASGLGHEFDPETGRYAGGGRPYVAWPSAGYTEATRADDLGALVPARLFLGPAWYERTFEIPAGRDGASWRFTLERVKWTSRLWVDGVEVTGSGTDSLHTPHRYRTGPLAAGPHRFTLRIDNRMPVNIGFAGHGYGMETEPIWHGAAGALLLEPAGPVAIDRIRLRPHLDGTIRIEVAGRGVPKHDVRVRARFSGSEKPGAPGGKLETIKNSGQVVFADPGPDGIAHFSTSFTLVLPGRPEPWDEFHPNLHRLDLSIIGGDDFPADTRTLRIGFRDFARDGNRLLINGVPLFLRGNLDCAIHPESDTPPTDRAWWERVLGIHKAAGFNHIRFHTWCPPEVAFDAADELGLYLQVETAYWVDNWIHDTAPRPPRLGGDPAVDAWVLAESKRILRAFGHHPSFVMFCLGNEFGMGSDWETIDRIVAELRQESDTVLVAGTAARKSVAHDEYWVTHVTERGGVRGLGPEHTDWDFSEALAGVGVPVISHETGQRQSWPDYDALISAFRPGGVIQPHNLARLRQRADAAGIGDHRARCEASVRFAQLLYKAEHEGMRRTRDLDGYQLLMLHDFTGQGEAFVGVLDPFFREKPGVSLDAVRAWNGPSVPLARFPSYIWTTDQSLAATFEFAHQGPGALSAARAEWSLHDCTGDHPVASGALDPVDAAPGAIAALGAIRVPLADVEAPARLELTLEVGGHRNSWPVWVYPSSETPKLRSAETLLTRRIDQSALDVLARGGSVLFLFHKAGGPRFRQTRWGSTFWTGAWGWGHGLGLMCDPDHPALAGFPNDGHSDWQWHDLAEGGTCISLNPQHAAAGTIVEQISTFHQPAREAFLVEARVGKGLLLACGFDLEHGLAQRHAARAMLGSLMQYAASGVSAPGLALTPAEAAEIFSVPESLGAVARADSEMPGYEAAMVLDGDPETFWHTSWGAIEPPHPHELIIEFKEILTLQGVRLRARADHENGRIAEFSLFLAERDGDWGKPVLDHAELANSADWQQLDFPPAKARFLRLLTHREVGGRPFASLADLLPITQ